MTAPRELWQGKHEMIMKEPCRQRDQAFLHTSPEAQARQRVGTGSD